MRSVVFLTGVAEGALEYPPEVPATGSPEPPGLLAQLLSGSLSRECVGFARPRLRPIALPAPGCSLISLSL